MPCKQALPYYCTLRCVVLQLEMVDPGTVLMWIFGSILALLWLLFLCYGEQTLIFALAWVYCCSSLWCQSVVPGQLS